MPPTSATRSQLCRLCNFSPAGPNATILSGWPRYDGGRVSEQQAAEREDMMMAEGQVRMKYRLVSILELGLPSKYRTLIFEIADMPT